MLLSFSDSLSGLFFALLGVYLFFASSATKLHFFLGVFLHFITGADILHHAEAAGGGGPGEPLYHLGQGRFQGFAVQPGGRDRFPGDLILPGP